MKNQLITNKQVSIVALSPLLDAAGNALVLQPKGAKGDEREITAETADDEIVKRVEKAGWVRLRPVGDVQPAQHTPPAPPVAVVPEPVVTPPPVAVVTPEPPPAPEPEVVPPAAIVAPEPETTQVMAPAEVETLVEQTKTPASEPPSKSKRQR